MVPALLAAGVPLALGLVLVGVDPVGLSAGAAAGGGARRGACVVMAARGGGIRVVPQCGNYAEETYQLHDITLYQFIIYE